MIKVYSKSNCPHCVNAKKYLKSQGLDFTETVLDDEKERLAFYEHVGAGVKSMPQIFFNGVRIGGFNELYSFGKEGKLKDLV